MSETFGKIEESWRDKLSSQFNKEYFQKLEQFIIQEKKTHTIYPPANKIFEAFNSTPFQHVKVVIIGQDPYHNTRKAHGLSFSVADNITPPPSLKNIFKEIQNDIGLEAPVSGNLNFWAQQGVLLLNSILTVRSNEPGSHRKKGWENFTDYCINILSKERKNIIFLLWGKYAQKKSKFINKCNHYVLECPHPSPLSAYSGFFGSKHFSKTNSLLRKLNKTPIKWVK